MGEFISSLSLSLFTGAAEVLAAALRQLVNAVEDVVDELDDFISGTDDIDVLILGRQTLPGTSLPVFISGSCGKFASWRGMDGEQELEWTTLHQASAYSWL